MRCPGLCPHRERPRVLALAQGFRFPDQVGDAVAYWQAQKLPRRLHELLAADQPGFFADDAQWNQYLQEKGLQGARHVQIATEGALIGSIIDHGISRNLVVVSDDAGQFDVLLHALCWIHAERSINKIIPMSEKGKDDLQQVRERLWNLYRDLNAYQKSGLPPGTQLRRKKYLSTVFFSLMMLASLMDQLLQTSCPLFREIRKKAGSKKGLWKKIRSVFHLFLVDSMEMIYRILLAGPQKIQPVFINDTSYSRFVLIDSPRNCLDKVRGSPSRAVPRVPLQFMGLPEDSCCLNPGKALLTNASPVILAVARPWITARAA
jgi:hypothetical protein